MLFQLVYRLQGRTTLHSSFEKCKYDQNCSTNFELFIFVMKIYELVMKIHLILNDTSVEIKFFFSRFIGLLFKKWFE